MRDLHPRPVTDHEAVFLDRLSRLQSRAMRLLGDETDAAKDLVQDAFVQFTLSRPDLARIANLDAYLFGLLRHMSLSRRRRRARDAELSLTVVDFDSAQLALDLTDPRIVTRARDDLDAVCRYVCARKQTAKLASVLILRFFHACYPNEIAAIVRGSMQMVDESLRRARAEVRALLANPGSLAAFQPPQARVTVPSSVERPDSDTGHDFLLSLRQIVFASCSSPCLPAADLLAGYRAAPAQPLDCGTLAHVVSCRRCLDLVTRVLGLPSASDRGPTDALGSGRRSERPAAVRSAHAGGLERRAYRQRAWDVFEHRPTALRIAIDGFVRVTHQISSSRTELTLTLDAGEQPDFIEVFSEQGLRLAMLSADAAAPREDGACVLRLDLSRGRRLEIQLAAGDPWPRLRTMYWDPDLEAPAAAVPLDAPVARPALEATESDANPATYTAYATHRTHARPIAWLRRVSLQAEAWLTAIAGRVGIGVKRPRLIIAGAVPLALILVMLWSGVTPASAYERVRRGIRFLQDLVLQTPEPPRARRLPFPLLTGLVDAPLPRAGELSLTPATASSPTASPRPDEATLAALEMNILVHLDRVGALYGEPVRVTRTPTSVRVEALAENAQRKAVLNAAIAPFAGRPELRVSVRSVEDVLATAAMPSTRRNATASGPTGMRDVAAADGRVPGFEAIRAALELERRRFSHPGGAVAIGDHEVDVFATRVLDRSSAARRHAWALQQVAERVSNPDDLRAISHEAASIWESLMETHTQQLAADVHALRSDLLAVFGRGPSAGAASAASAATTDSAPQAQPVDRRVHADITAIVRLATDLDDVVRSAFSLSPARGDREDFIPRVARALELATWIESHIARRPAQPDGEGVPPASLHNQR